MNQRRMEHFRSRLQNEGFMHLARFWPLTLLISRNAGSNLKNENLFLLSKGRCPPSFLPTDPSRIFSGTVPGCLRMPPGRQRKGLKRPETALKKALGEAYPLSPADYIVVSPDNCCKRFSGSATIMQIQFKMIHKGLTKWALTVLFARFHPSIFLAILQVW